MKKTTGTLYLVATPIGNREDITLRALRILREVNLIAAEDTRHSKSLLQHYDITTPLISLHEFNETARIPLLLDRIRQGEEIALISDAGTPLISDPGYLLVKSAHESGIQVTPIPGACAAIAALCASGLPTDHFIFEGFFPSQKSERNHRLESLKQESRTLIFYEAPHRIASCVQAIADILGADREIVLAKELTKTFETFVHDTAQAAINWLQNDTNHQKGEFVVLIRGAIIEKQQDVSEDTLRILNILSEHLPQRQAVELTAKITGEKKNALKMLCFKK
jgi:16S rRNA (cytidine1402-2'-O)-methyltransferase